MSFRRRLPLLIGGIFLLILVIGVVLMIRKFLDNPDQPNTRRVQQVSLIKPPEPPPPPPKPPEVKPPEVKEEVKLDKPAPPEPAAAAPPGNGLATSPDGDSSFGPGGPGNGPRLNDTSIYRQYLGGLQKSIRDELNRSEGLRKGEYRAEVAIWISINGSVDRIELVGSSGEANVDTALKKALDSIRRLEQPPPEMPQPVKLRISSR